MMVSLRPKLGFASKSGAHDPATFDENDAKFESVLEFMENHLGRFSKWWSAESAILWALWKLYIFKSNQIYLSGNDLTIADVSIAASLRIVSTVTLSDGKNWIINVKLAKYGAHFKRWFFQKIQKYFKMASCRAQTGVHIMSHSYDS